MLLAKIAIICFGPACTLDANLTDQYATRLACTRELAALHQKADHYGAGATLAKAYCVDAYKARATVEAEAGDLEAEGLVVHRMVNL